MSTPSKISKRKCPDTASFVQKSKKKAKKTEDVLSETPDSINIEQYVEKRASEIRALTDQVEKQGGMKLVSQRLPRHMRRRALSHDIRRLPKRLREAAAKEIERATNNKKPSRKHRRRPKNLLCEYERRQRKITWLETHIWHAKRFRMVDKWGYKLALHPNDKCIRACHRAADKYSLLQDVSFECCIQLTGSESIIRKCLAKMVSDKTGPTVLGRKYMSGGKWGETVLYNRGQYPLGAIGKISFLWRPIKTQEPDNRQLWIWCHPSIYGNIWEELKKSIVPEVDQLNPSQQSNKLDMAEIVDKKSEGSDPSVKPEQTDRKDEKDATPTLKEEQFCAEGIQLKSLKDVCPKFRLIGRNSQAILSEVMQLCDIDNTTDGDFWWQKFYANEENKNTSLRQKEVFDWLKTHQSQIEVPPHQVVALTVRDPRLLLPPKRMKVMPSSQVEEPAEFPKTDNAADSPLWEEDVRNSVNNNKMSDHELNKKRANNLVPGTPLNLGSSESRVPVLLLQRPGHRPIMSKSNKGKPQHRSIREGFGGGWDVIVPPGWGKSFLIALVFRGCRVGGMREASAVLREAGELDFPSDFPDTAAGKAHAEEVRDELQKKYDRNPPAKRPNFNKMGITYPFSCPWKQLVNEWKMNVGTTSSVSLKMETESKTESLGPKAESLGLKAESLDPKGEKEAVQMVQHSKGGGDFFVLRNLKQLRLLNESINFVDKTSVENSFDAFSRRGEVLEMLSAAEDNLVPVLITMHDKGVPSQFGHICIPMGEDFDFLKEDSDLHGPLEPKHPDLEGYLKKKNKMNLKKSKNTKSSLLNASLMNPSNPMDKAMAAMITANGSGNDVLSSKTDTQEISCPDGSNMSQSLISSSCRKIIGFVNNGDFSLGQGQGHGKGFCSLIGLVELLKNIPANRPSLILVRNTTTLQYRFAWISVLM